MKSVKGYEVITRTAEYTLEKHQLHIGEEKFEIGEDDLTKFTILHDIITFQC